MTRVLALISVLCLLALTVQAPGCASTSGCKPPDRRSARGGEPPFDIDDDGNPVDNHHTQRQKARANLDRAASALGWVAGVCAVAAVGMFAASFVPGFGAFVPRGVSLSLVAASAGCYAGSYALTVYGVLFAELAVWLAFGACGVLLATTGVPLALAWRNRTLAKTSQALAAGGHHDAAVALEATAKPRQFKTREARRARLRELTEGAAT